MTELEVTEGVAVSMSFSLPLGLKRRLFEKVPKNRSEYITKLIAKDLAGK